MFLFIKGKIKMKKKNTIINNLVSKPFNQVKKHKLITLCVILSAFWVFNIPHIEVEVENIPIIKKIEEETNNIQEISGYAKIIDGDSISIDSQQIRLINIDAPEYKQKCLNARNIEYFCGKESAIFLKKILDGRVIRCEYEKKDIYSRILGNCFTKGSNINETLIKAGMAIIYSFDKVDEKLKAMEENARLRKYGVWRGTFLEPRKYRKKIRINKLQLDYLNLISYTVDS